MYEQILTRLSKIIFSKPPQALVLHHRLGLASLSSERSPKRTGLPPHGGTLRPRSLERHPKPAHSSMPRPRYTSSPWRSFSTQKAELLLSGQRCRAVLCSHWSVIRGLFPPAFSLFIGRALVALQRRDRFCHHLFPDTVQIRHAGHFGFISST